MGKNIENEDWREEAPILAGIPVREVFSVPENYFEQLSASIEAEISVERLRALSAEEAYTVPAGYFEQMTSEILSKTKSPSKIIRLWRSNALKYASAACFLLVAGVGIYFNREQPEQVVNYTEVANEQMLFDIDEDVIIEHIEATTIAAKQISNEDADLENYILNNFSSNELTAEY